MEVHPPRAPVGPVGSVGPAQTGPGCEQVADGLLREPVSAVTSLAFVVAGVVVVLAGRRRAAGSTGRRAQDREVLGYAALVAAVGVGSFVQHGPDPVWSDVAHDLPLLATLAFLGADAAADLTARARAWWWWAAPVAVLLPVVVLMPRPGDLAQVGVAVVAVTLTVLRAVAHRRLARRITGAVVLLLVGSGIGTLSRAGWPWCDPAAPLPGHGVWHLLAATALAVLAPTVGRRRDRAAGSRDG